MTADLGDLVRLHGDFVDTDEDYLDPGAVSLYIRKPTGAVVTLVYGTDVAVVRSATGRYQYDLDANISGVWFYRWISTGTGQAAGEDQLTVTKPKAVP